VPDKPVIVREAVVQVRDDEDAHRQIVSGPHPRHQGLRGPCPAGRVASMIRATVDETATQ
jgi:hypothetical protein